MNVVREGISGKSPPSGGGKDASRDSEEVTTCCFTMWYLSVLLCWCIGSSQDRCHQALGHKSGTPAGRLGPFEQHIFLSASGDTLGRGEGDSELDCAWIFTRKTQHHAGPKFG